MKGALKMGFLMEKEFNILAMVINILVNLNLERGMVKA